VNKKRPSQGLNQQPKKAELSRAIRGIGEPAAELSLDRLFFSSREIQFIAAAAPVGQIKKAVGFDASRGLAMSDELSHYRVVHFAAHGLLNDKHPELSGIVLSLLDRQGKEQDGFLTLADVFRMNLTADLVVLSACGTALGREVRGEGLIGLTRGFMYAGAARVVASLWNVDDAATADLMAHFYKRLLKDGQRPAEALRWAQAEMREQKRWRHPYYWAAFVLQGEWR
jgi:CHAT domain-containing protein